MSNPVGIELVRSTRGASARIAKALKITRGAVSQWDKVPAEFVVEIEQATGLSREELRPDLFRREEAQP
ncbi:transcriptional regulator [Acetobacter sicerae]|uniref:transcriptional regulator n=1 Tax=Acetobacter sicerae TaxID=85325 RepID=UPI00156B4915|nr:Cro/CI family transcriptional regulator [Acetobacter sicerae]NHN93804.1 hypothetical protein [Acetobacter sicerae]